MHWKLKALVFRTLSVTPFGTHVHFQLQKHVTKEWPRSTAALDEPDVCLLQQAILDRLAPQFREFEVPDLFTIRAMIVAIIEKP
jgi:hypothetical protein